MSAVNSKLSIVLDCKYENRYRTQNSLKRHTKNSKNIYAYILLGKQEFYAYDPVDSDI